MTSRHPPEPPIDGQSPPARPARVGRAPTSSRDHIEATAFRLFSSAGFEATTVSDIAEAAGIGRRTFFRYFASKNDLVWSDLEHRVARIEHDLRHAPRDLAVLEAIRGAILGFVRPPTSDIHQHRQRITLLLHNPSLIGWAAPHFHVWRNTIARHIADRVEIDPEDHRTQAAAWTCYGLLMTIYTCWLTSPDQPLDAVAHTALAQIHDVAHLVDLPRPRHYDQ